MQPNLNTEKIQQTLNKLCNPKSLSNEYRQQQSREKYNN